MTTVDDAAVHPEFATGCRVSYRQPVSGSGYVDAGWWPRSWDLSAELPALFESVWTAGRNMTRVAYNLDTWEPTARRMMLEGRRLHLGGFHWQDRLTMSMSDARHRDTITFLVIPFDTDAAVAERELGFASEPGNTSRPQQMVDAARG